MTKIALTLSAVAGLLIGSAVHADPLYPNGTIIGVFSDVVRAGDYLNYPALGQQTYFDNTNATPVYSISNSSDPTLVGTPPLQSTGSALRWGSYPPGFGIDPENSFSELNFFGAPIPSDIHQQFQLGTITYLNGTSEISTQIFGATISFYDNVVSPINYLGSDTIYINTTNNFNQDTSQDADWINICGNNSNICNSRVEAVETSEGGTGVTAILTGTIVGDPVLEIDGVTVPNSSATTGFVGAGPELAIPEPSSLAVFALGLVGTALLGRRSRFGRVRLGRPRDHAAG